MAVNHHLTPETLLEYSSGALPASMETLVACHLTVCPQCRSNSDMADRLGGEILSIADTVPMRAAASDVLERLNSDISASSDEITAPSAIKRNIPAGIPRPLGRLIPAPLEELDWRRMAPGIKHYKLAPQPSGRGAFKLLHLAPGVTLSDHTHADKELTYVVKGSYTDNIGRFAAGDIADLDGNHSHKPVVDSAEPCIALIATHSPARYNSVFGKIMQPFVGI